LKRLKDDEIEDKIKLHFGRYYKERYVFWIKRLMPPRENYVYLYCDTDGDNIICNWTQKLCIAEEDLPKNLRWIIILSDKELVF